MVSGFRGCWAGVTQRERGWAVGPRLTHRQGHGRWSELRGGQPGGEGGEGVLVRVRVPVSVLVELGPWQGPPQGSTGPFGALDQEACIQLLPEKLVV